VRTWPAIDAGRLKAAPTTESDSDVGAAFRRPDLLEAALTDFNIAAVDEATPESWRIYFHTVEDRDQALNSLHASFPDLTLSSVDVPDEDWAARSQASLSAVQVGRLIVAPPWDVPVVITIQPSMGFGTGHHATTRLCLSALQAVDVKGRTALDIGTGSAVLAIAASLLGASDVTGIDDDPDAIHAAWENLALNPAASVTLIVGDLRATDLVPAEVVLANLTGGLLVASADRLQALTIPGGRLILSGLLQEEESRVLDAFAGRTVEHRRDEDGWVCVALV
jgi:ribosomal protein L11 methyltransferase